MLSQDSEDENLLKICVWTCDMTSRSCFGKMNSTLGSVVPLAMFHFKTVDLFRIYCQKAKIFTWALKRKTYTLAKIRCSSILQMSFLILNVSVLVGTNGWMFGRYCIITWVMIITLGQCRKWSLSIQANTFLRKHNDPSSVHWLVTSSMEMMCPEYTIKAKEIVD